MVPRCWQWWFSQSASDLGLLPLSGITAAPCHDSLFRQCSLHLPPSSLPLPVFNVQPPPLVQFWHLVSVHPRKLWQPQLHATSLLTEPLVAGQRITPWFLVSLVPMTFDWLQVVVSYVLSILRTPSSRWCPPRPASPGAPCHATTFSPLWNGSILLYQPASM